MQEAKLIHADLKTENVLLQVSLSLSLSLSLFLSSLSENVLLQVSPSLSLSLSLFLSSSLKMSCCRSVCLSVSFSLSPLARSLYLFLPVKRSTNAWKGTAERLYLGSVKALLRLY
jgi:hypothetical protein